MHAAFRDRRRRLRTPEPIEIPDTALRCCEWPSGCLWSNFPLPLTTGGEFRRYISPRLHVLCREFTERHTSNDAPIDGKRHIEMPPACPAKRSTTMNQPICTAEDRFEIGGEVLLPPRSAVSPSDDPEKHDESAFARHWEKNRKDVRVRVGTLLKTETVSFLLGAGASVNCGGELIGSVPLSVERDLCSRGITGTARFRMRRWLRVFYLGIKHSCRHVRVPVTRDEILDRWRQLDADEAKALKVSFERVLETLHSWRAALPDADRRLRVDSAPRIDVKGSDLALCLDHATRSLAATCQLPTPEKRAGIGTYRKLVRKLLTRPLNLKRVNIFTLNYDTLVEQASDATGVVLLDGFVGTQRRVFRPESYEQDLYFPAETTEGHVHRFDRVLHLYKLHGSITWSSHTPSMDDPYGIRSSVFDPNGEQPVLIYPTPAKYGETLGLPYSELFRRFASALVRPQSVLFVIGYGFGDEHVNSIIRQALAVPSFTIVIVDPCPKSDFVKELRQQQDRRVWIAEGPKLGTIAGFVDQVLPDLRDEEIRKKVVETHNAVQKLRNSQHGNTFNDG